MATQTTDFLKTTAGRPLLIVYARLATTANVNLTTDVHDGSTIDGVTVAAGDVLLIKDHATGATKGLYVAPAASGTAKRHHLMRVGADVHGVCVRVEEGTANGGKTFWCLNAEGAGVVGTDALDFDTDAAGGGVTDHGALTGLTDADHPAGAIAFTATDKLLGRSSSGAGAGEEIACTAAGRAILDDADAAAQRTTLGLGSLATVTPTGTPDGTKFLRDDGAYAVPAGGDALTTNPLSQFAATTSAQLRGVLSDETGTGAAVFADSPTLVTPALGTPASGTLTNCTGLPTAGLVDAAVTYAKIQDVSAASKLLGRGDSGSGDVQEITLGTNLSMSGTTLNATGGGGSETVTHLESGRLTLTTAVPITTSDVTGSTIHWTPYKSSHVRLYYSSAWSYRTAVEVSLALSGMTTGRGQDFFLYWTGSALALERVEWTSGTARATALALQDNVYVKSGDATRLYVGSGLAESSTTIKDRSDGVRGLWNMYNRVWRTTRAPVAPGYWNGTGSYRVYGGSGNQVQFFSGLQEDAVHIAGYGEVYGDSTWCYVGVGVNSTSAPSGLWGNVYVPVWTPISCCYSGIPRLGESTYSLVESLGTGAYGYGDGVAGEIRLGLEGTTRM